MKHLIWLIILCCLLSGCMQPEIIAPTATPVMTRRPQEPTLPPTPFPTPTLPLLTPKPTQPDVIEPDFSALVLEGSEMTETATVVISLEGDSVDVVSSIEITSVKLLNNSINFIPLNQQEILALEDKYSTSIFYGVIISSDNDGIYDLTFDVTHKDGKKSQATVSVEINYWGVYE